MMPSEEIKNIIEEQLQSSTNTKKLNMAPFVSRLRAETYRKASYRIMEKTLGIDIQQRGKQNFTALIERLRSGDKSHTPQMRELLQSKKKPNVVLTPEERKFLSEMLKCDWMLKHATLAVEEIQQSERMLSLEERIRRGMDTSNAHTPSGEGHIDNIFFTYGPARNLATVRFMGDASSVVTVDPEVLHEHNPSALHGLWGSDHFYSYTTEQEGFSTRIGDCQYSVYYRNAQESNTESGVHLVRICQFNRADGASFTQQFAKGEEIFTYPRINQGILLSVIEKVRLMGHKTWNLVMNSMSIEEQERLVQVLFHPGVFEVHQPRLFTINQPGVRIVNRSKEMKCDAESRAFAALSQAILKAAFEGKIKEVLEFCHNYKDNFSEVRGRVGKIFNSLTLLGAAILGGHVELVKALLDQGIDTSMNYKLYSPVSPLILAFCLANPNKSWDITANKEAAIEIIRLLVEVGTVDRDNPHVRHLLPVTSAELQMGLEEYCVPPDFITYLLHTLGVRLNPRSLPLALAVNSRNIIAVEMMRSLGAKADARLSTTSGDLESGCTPLLIAAAQGDDIMVEALLKQNAPIDQEFSASRCVGGVPVSAFVHPLEGYTSLLAAVEEEHLLVVQRLVRNGANVLHRSATGKTALSIAIEKGYSSIRDYLLDVISKLKDTQELSALQRVEQAQSEGAKIQEHVTHIVFTGNLDGKRFFVVPQREKDTMSPFIGSIPTRHFNGGVSKTDACEEMITTINKFFSLDIHFSKLKWGSVGEFSCYVPESKIHYAENVVFCELDNPHKIKEKILSSRFHNLRIIMESDSSQHAVQDLWWPNLTTALFAYINMLLSSDDKISKEAYETLRVRYQATVKAQHQMLEAAKTGDKEKIDALLHQGVALWYPTLTPEASRSVPWQVAYQNQQFDCAIHILKQIPKPKRVSILNKFITIGIIEEIVERGNVELYTALHEMGHEDFDFSKRAMSVNSWYHDAFKDEQLKLATYIAKSMSRDHGLVFEGMVEAILSTNFDQVLNSLEALPEPDREQFLRFCILPKMIRNIVRSGNLALYKKIHEMKNRYTDFAKYPKKVESFLDIAIASKHQPLVRYIADSASEQMFSAMIVAIESKAWDKALELLKSFDEDLSEKTKAFNARLRGFEESCGVVIQRAGALTELPPQWCVDASEKNMLSKCLNHWLDFKLIYEVIASGHLEFCKALHEKGLQNMVCTASLSRAIEYNQEAIALYILESLKPEETHRPVLIRAAEHRGLMNVVALLSSQIAVEKPASEEPVHLYVRGFDAVRDETKAPKVDGKPGNTVKVTGQTTT